MPDALTMTGLAVGYGDRCILSGLNSVFPAGSVSMVLGPNGVGKTSLLQTLGGLMRPLAGSVHLSNIELHTLRSRLRARQVAFVKNHERLTMSMTVRQIVALGRTPYRAWWRWDDPVSESDLIATALRRCALESFAEKSIAVLSSGEQQRVWIALALVQATPLVLLDEPTSTLDIKYARDILRMLREIAADGATIIATMHDIQLAAIYADHIVLLADGGVFARGAPQDALRPEILKQVYGESLELRFEPSSLWMGMHR